MQRTLPGQTVGIDLGSLNSAIAQLNDDGQLLILPNSEQQNFTPSVVLLPDGKFVVGPTFERISQEPPENVVESIKRLMGNREWFKLYQGKKLTPEFISALILKRLKQDAEKHIGPVTNAVITVPYHFNDARRKATQDAGRIAGLNVLDIINDPTAATLAYFWVRGEFGLTIRPLSKRTILVYHLGGTFAVSVTRYIPTSFYVLATDADEMLGGCDWTRRVVDDVSELFASKFGGADPRTNSDAMLTLTRECEEAKRSLCSQDQVPIGVSFEGNSLTISLTRDHFERLTLDLLHRTRDATQRVLSQAGIQADQLDDVVLVGGSTHMPQIKSMLGELCSRQPFQKLNPNAATAQGAAIHAAIYAANVVQQNY